MILEWLVSAVLRIKETLLLISVVSYRKLSAKFYLCDIASITAEPLCLIIKRVIFNPLLRKPMLTVLSSKIIPVLLLHWDAPVWIVH